MIDICYVGNSSNDTIKIKDHTYNTLGGSSIYSSFSSRNSSDGRIAIISKVDAKTKLNLEKNGIEFYGQIVNKMSEFIIDEEKDTCIANYYNNDPISLNNQIHINHLHISLRKGIEFEEIFNNEYLHYQHLSVDVMIHSVHDFIPVIEKYSSKIEILFCNIKEYNILKKYIKEIPLTIVTNEDKPVIVVTPNNIKAYDIANNKNIKSTTGAGDTFIGGFLAKYIINKNLDEAISQGIYNSNKSIEKIGPLLNQKYQDNQNIKPSLLPNNLIVIGNSCAGKTTFINWFKNKYNIYFDIDDLAPLLETFMLDDLLHQNKIKDFKEIKEKLKYIKEIWEEYSKNIDSIKFYTQPSKSGNGHDIIRPILWDYIIDMATKNAQNNNIIQFSRGKDELYENEFKENAYLRSIKKFIYNLPNNDNCIIINLVSNLDIRKERNTQRFLNGGHYVSNETMENVYSSDIFDYSKTSENLGYLTIDEKKIPVFTIINDKMLNEIELDEFLEYNVNEVIKYYNQFMEDEHGFKKNTKRYLAK